MNFQGRIQDFQLVGAPMLNGYEHEKRAPKARSIPRGVWAIFGHFFLEFYTMLLVRKRCKDTQIIFFFFIFAICLTWHSMETHGQIHRFSMEQHGHTLKTNHIDHGNPWVFHGIPMSFLWPYLKPQRKSHVLTMGNT